MQWLNYHHLHYFHVVAREGSIARACTLLRVAQPTVSGQLKLLEESLGTALFERRGRKLVLTPVGHTVQRHATEIFALGRSLQSAVAAGLTDGPAPLRVGIADSVPRLVAHTLLEPVLQNDPPVQLVCTHDRAERLLGSLAIAELDLVLSDSPLAATTPIRAYNHLLCESGVTFFAAPSLARSLSGRFPASLHAAPMLLPSRGAELRRSLDAYFGRHGFEPRTVAEFDDSALMKSFGEGGAGVFAAPSMVAAEIRSHYGVKVLGSTEEIRERIYAIAVERRLTHPAAIAIANRARAGAFRTGHIAGP